MAPEISAVRRYNGASVVDIDAYIKKGGVLIPLTGETPEPGPSQTVTYESDTTTDFLNPGRGFHKNFTGSVAAVRTTHGMTLNRRYMRLDSWRNTTLPSTFLNELSDVFAAHRSAGVQIILRFSYNFGFQDDAPLSRILQHIGQLTPVVQANLDVLATLQAGFVGAWGEWHSSTNGLTLNNSAGIAARKQIGLALLDMVGPTRTVQFRTPSILRDIFDNDTGIPAFDGSPKARAGAKNDSFVVNASNAGTFVSSPLSIDRTTFERFGRAACVGGESSEVGWSGGSNPPPAGTNAYNNGAASLDECVYFHYDYLNEDYYVPIINLWKASDHYDEIRRRMGYRLTLEQAVLPTTLAASAPAFITLRIDNSGFGKVYNPRPIDLVLVGPGGPFTVRLLDDMRPVLPRGGETRDVELGFVAPAGLTPGSYAMHIRMAAPESGIQSDNRYAIRFANSGGLYNESTGRNNLNASVTVS